MLGAGGTNNERNLYGGCGMQMDVSVNEPINFFLFDSLVFLVQGSTPSFVSCSPSLSIYWVRANIRRPPWPHSLTLFPHWDVLFVCGLWLEMWLKMQLCVENKPLTAQCTTSALELQTFRWISHPYLTWLWIWNILYARWAQHTSPKSDYRLSLKHLTA